MPTAVTAHTAIRLGILLTAAAPILFVRLDEPTSALQVFKLLAKTGSLAGTVLLVWQMILGFRGLSSRLTSDVIWATELHQRLGAWALPLILLHPVFITLYYLGKHGRNLWMLPRGRPFDTYVVVGMGGLAVLAVIVVTSVFLRRRMGNRAWYCAHLSSYLLIPAVFVHSFPIGGTVRGTALYWGWVALAALAAGVLGFRLLFHLALTQRHRATRVVPQGPRTAEIFLEPVDAAIEPKMGQFVYVRRGRWHDARPYTVSAYDPSAGILSITVKAYGPTSTNLQQTVEGDLLVLDGPYGVFTQDALETGRPIVMAAGGIGITAFRRVIQHLESSADRPAFLFYGNLTAEHICYGPELAQLIHVQVIHVMNEAPDWPGETGYITTDLMERYVEGDLSKCEVLICGPPPMVNTLEDQLAARGVPAEQVHHELFD